MDLSKKGLLQPGAALSIILAILHVSRTHCAITAAVLADDVLGRLVQQPGSLLGSLHASLQPIAESFGSWSAASQALRELAKHKGLQKQLQALHLGRLLLRYSRMVFPRCHSGKADYRRRAYEALKLHALSGVQDCMA